MRTPILTGLLLLAGVSHGEVVHVPIKSGAVLKPGQSYTATIDAGKPTEIGWRAVQAKQCSTNCVQASDLTGPMHGSVATSIGASQEYTPASGKISIEYKNVSNEPVTINVFRVQRTCEAEACKFFDPQAKGRPLTFKIAAFKSITTSKDESYSLISGRAMSGRPFTVRTVWWTDDKNAFRFSCTKWIKRYIDEHTPPERYRPYILAGMAVSEGDIIVLKSIDDCVPNAPHYGVEEKNVFK
jgi:hypothetical protein